MTTHTRRELLQLLQRHGLRLSKRFGQHFLIDPALCRSLVARCGLSRADRVVEIGPGLGSLTGLLADAAGEVLAVEIDQGFCRALQERMVGRDIVRVMCEDILEFSWANVPATKVIGAIPYHITSPILLMLCQQVRRIPEAWLGLQQEVGERVMAKPGTKAYGRLSILVQYHFEIARVAKIPRQAFFPQPEVDSIWLHLRGRPKPAVAVRDEALFFDVVRVAFGQRRKTLLNCLLQLPRPALTRQTAAEALRSAGLSPTIRGETLSLSQFARLADILSALPTGAASDGGRVDFAGLV
jgi:16S rRNA (adenine1518-N6/adenine1519-N6)-dimethyltransferase